MGIFDLLGLKRTESGAEENNSALGGIARRIDALGAEKATLVAAFAAVLVRAARSDLDVSDEESARMADIVSEFGGLSTADASLVVEMATEISTERGSAHDYLVTRELHRLAGPKEREQLLSCIFAVCAADDSITLDEEEEVRQMATELGFEHQEYTKARAAFKDQREIIRRLRK